MPDPIEEFRAWYHGPDGKHRWIATAESVEGFLARAFQAGWVRRGQQPPEEPLPVRMQISPEGLRELENEQFQHRVPLPVLGEEHPGRPAPGPAPVTRISDYVMTSGEPARDEPDQTMTWPRVASGPPISFGRRATPGLPPSAVRTEPKEGEDAPS